MNAILISQAELDRTLAHAEGCRKEADRAILADAKAHWLGSAARFQKHAEWLAELLESSGD